MLVGNDVSGAQSRGVAIGKGSSPVLTGNTICGNAVNLHVDDEATPQIGKTNAICEDEPIGADE